jgi:predicted nucleotidyltransferase component of viral defense system
MALNIALHKSILLSILKDIFTDAELSQSLGFKGGTAMLLFYHLNRFSVDLEFDLLDQTKEEYVFEEIKKILEKYGTFESHKKRYTLFFILSYKGNLPDAQKIELEINKRSFGSKYEIKHHLSVAMPAMVEEDVAAHKLVAMYERMGEANRDIFDVYFIFHNHWSINKKIVEQRTGMSYKDFLQHCITALEKFNDKTILSGLGELLNEKQKAWVKSKLKNDTLFLLRVALSNEK